MAERLPAHRLIAWAQDTDPEVADALIDRLFRAYFVEGIDIGNIDANAGLQLACNTPSGWSG